MARVVVLVVLAVTVALGLVPRRSASGNVTVSARPVHTLGVRPLMAAADRRDCIALLTAGLRGNLVAMDAGRPVPGTSTDQLIARRWPVGSAQRARVQDAYDAVLVTAASDLFGRYGRDAQAEVAGYGPRIAAACG